MDVRLMLTGLVSFFWGGFVTPLSIRLAYNYQIMDLPDHRKIHKERTPRGAGLGLWAGYLLWALCSVSGDPLIRYSATAATLVFFCGYMDDMKSLSPFIRLAVHLFAAALIVFPLPLPFPSRILCLVWIAGTTSAYNLIDGVNGLCISVFISSTATLCVVGDASFGVMGAATALGVLCWNFPLAQTFLGDGGSTLLGFLFASHFVTAASTVLATRRLHELILVFLLVGGVPVLDTLVAFSRRILGGRSPFYPDRGHLHHHFMEWTRSPFWAVTCLLLLHAFFLAGGVAVYTKLR
ncbi:MAG: undecaprenyl/decaprenyl-phosphate alpha-N-acetylglucosaminyl 1-phosphate transferase [Synergistaceae bacterium]|jgi:UDP-GlcNAc:undecaprenyl-phosphate GlcNAc-1-phosphate transferase|nr:undecaprenyl/decaprenyl-phosphate alpha-N-acetylglucosaminyl 1-phosphate transferase [Synergistaceae bacterium]